jgi:hypothetical protein
MAGKKRNVFVLMLIAGIVVCVTMGLVLKITGSGIPRIEVSPQVMDLGIIDCLEPNLPDRIKFEIRNRGTDVLNLTKIILACACSKTLLDKDVLLPGEVAHLSSRIAVPNRVGEFRKKILIQSNDPREPVKELVIKGRMHRPCYVLPDSIVVSNLCKGEEQEIKLEVTGPAGEKSFVIHEVSATNDEIQSQKIERIGIMIESGRPIWRISLTVASRGSIEWKDTIRISTSCQESPLLEVPVKVKELPHVKVYPALVIMRCSTDNETPTAQVEITTNTYKQATIIDIKKPDWIDVHVEHNDNNLPAKLKLMIREVNDIVKTSTQGEVVLKLGGELGEVRIPILVL